MNRNILLKVLEGTLFPAHLFRPLSCSDDPSSPGHVLHFPPDIPKQSERVALCLRRGVIKARLTLSPSK